MMSFFTSIKDDVREFIRILVYIIRNHFLPSFVLSEYPNEAYGKLIPRLFIVYFVGLMVIINTELSIIYVFYAIVLLVPLTYVEDTYVRSKVSASTPPIEKDSWLSTWKALKHESPLDAIASLEPISSGADGLIDSYLSKLRDAGDCLVSDFEVILKEGSTIVDALEICLHGHPTPEEEMCLNGTQVWTRFIFDEFGFNQWIFTCDALLMKLRSLLEGIE